MFSDTRHALLGTAVFCVAAMLAAPTTAQEAVCGSLRNAYGPFDYRIAPQDNRRIVEGAHFTPEVELLQGGHTSSTPAGDISYTLRAFPNHPRALMAMMKYAERVKQERPRDSAHTMACWFDRAERFTPDDATVKGLYGMYLSRKGKKAEAIKKLDEARALGTSSPNMDYNIGLIYFDLGEYDKSLTSAHRAYAGGFNLPGLKEKLVRAGKWKEQVKTPMDAASPPPAGTK